MMSIYDELFYKNNVSWGSQSAEIVVPILLDLFPVKSIVDFGCGRGTWLSVFKKYGITEVMGFDGDYVTELQIDEREFIACDLKRGIVPSRQYDMAISFEVAEHLPEESAEIFVNSLTDHSDLVIFSAAIPRQGGIGHINEQWQGYWSKLFAERGYKAIDIVRKKLNGLKTVRPYYRQNMIVYTKDEELIEKFKSYVVDTPEEYMIAETVEWMVDGYEKRISNLQKKMQIIREFSLLYFDGAIDNWLKNLNIKNIAIYGMGIIGEFLNDLFKEYNTFCYDSYDVRYKKYDAGNINENIDLTIITLVENIETIESEINGKNYYSIEKLIHEIKNKSILG